MKQMHAYSKYTRSTIAKNPSYYLLWPRNLSHKQLREKRANEIAANRNLNDQIRRN